MGRTYSAASSPPVSGTRLGAWPQARVATHHYASSDTTLAESTPPSPRNQPPPYRDEALTTPPYYQDDVFGRRKKHGELPKKTLVIRLCTSIFIAFLVCLIVAAVVGRIHDTQLGKKQDAQESAAQGPCSTSSSQNREANRYNYFDLWLPICDNFCYSRTTQVKRYSC
ncbi:hypothetical protein CRV24_008426 [Beauveria bassiana]|nr:hypothetical protein CRV24_008426 [Beauveria bassiana]